MKIGLIGLGRIGAFHAQTLAGLDAVDELIVTDARSDAIAAVAAGTGAVAAASPEELLGMKPDGVVIAAATASHPELLLAAADAGLPVFCEKPLATRIDDGVDVASKLAGRDERVHIGFPRRFDAGFVAARAAVQAGDLGRVFAVRATTLDPAPPSADYIRTSGGIFRDCGVHDFDALRWVTGREVVEVYATGDVYGDPVFAESGDVSTGQVVLTLDNGSQAVVTNSRYNRRGYDVRMELHGDADSIAVGLDTGLPLRSVEPDVHFPGGRLHETFMDRLAPAFRAELTAFTELVAGTRETPCSVSDALAADWIAEAATLSLRSHRSVRLDEVTR
ncbi:MULTISPECIES: Gfo/Idh/MocA family protein [Pseudonocardia]|uniref:Inositol 2-dehydrogenase n=2 Tax=Pseudonocardia TaxID=1847 RepID=A0A1Y2MT50_PSEAH|nr:MULTISPECIES: Gfo/Idh/MocA family oxidoreductase [Pseudonocardia]OSY38384.1 Inositol 2-dehydrogenase [Pseudonocardia autotrophica]TDN72572.1 myo-inositol 2-dehydrogenase/D-chiro-inositol 1-dehydrogenase [Pseudonocardia autotrophica]BBG03280.1 oxidoreductase [Pseudonocardia autotrophica]GEC24538.1 oxidoreductase [Pseudonocardia saturnea]